MSAAATAPGVARNRSYAEIDALRRTVPGLSIVDLCGDAGTSHAAYYKGLELGGTPQDRTHLRLMLALQANGVKSEQAEGV